ncbi:type II toxin-antitoxin system HipA family toxin [Dactylosporangium roseum]|uniref:Type II toxin-antitoxin system HipA family toxin n=1 Tax=Dactylosporangium roseum TaxID=47989 RepID=A0ABY5Z2I2_9ACTN|nr:type II toxin-antitoxin system HipA family toxin [Dactylosporangium roseum]UWZ36230.1 type II toxin-antitoxin system HipA family toxin [Dactylosporangium roseum]
MAPPRDAFVWAWLPGATEPVVAGRVVAVDGDRYVFAYGQSYLARPDAVPLYAPELPLREGPIEPRRNLPLAGCLRDASPDAWGRRVILARRFGHLDRDADTASLDELTYMLTSGSDRVGGLDFQASATQYVARDETAELAELIGAAEALEAGRPLSPALGEALTRGTSIGGARPKVTVLDQGRHLIAKLSSTSDYYPVVKAEAVGMILARRVGLNVAACEVIRCAGRDVLLVERFDRTTTPGQRRMMVSALTILGEDEMGARHAGYPDLADAVRKQFTDAGQHLRELFARMVFNVCIGNTDDHLRNHAAFWDGVQLSLTPAYDLCPQPRSGETANQALNLTRTPGERASQLRLCRKAAPEFLLSDRDADQIIEAQLDVIRRDWDDAADEAQLTKAERGQLWQRQILNPYIHYDQA